MAATAATPVPAWYSASDENLQADTSSIRTIDPYGRRLIKYIGSSQSDIAFPEYRTLHRLNITHLQNELAKLKSACHDDSHVEDNLEKVEQMLHRYVTAIRDYAFMESLEPVEENQAETHRVRIERAFFDIADLPRSPFDSRYLYLKRPKGIASDPLRKFLMKILPRGIAYTKKEASERENAFLAREPPKTVSEVVDNLARFLLALAGGAALVVPMLVMLLPSVDLVKSLLTICISVFLFAFAISVVVQAGNAEAVVATSTYAAVLVVFIGVNS